MSGEAKLIAISDVQLTRELGLVYRRDRTLPRAAAAFVTLLRQQISLDGGITQQNTNAARRSVCAANSAPAPRRTLAVLHGRSTRRAHSAIRRTLSHFRASNIQQSAYYISKSFAQAESAMLIKKAPDLTYNDVTPKSLYMGRRNFLFGLAATYGAVVGYKKLTRLLEGPGTGSTPVKLMGVTKWPGSTTEKETPLEDVTHYNNFYEFGTGKTDPADKLQKFRHHAVERFRRRRSKKQAASSRWTKS